MYRFMDGFCFRQLKPDSHFVRHADRKNTKPRKSRRDKIYISAWTTCVPKKIANYVRNKAKNKILIRLRKRNMVK